MTVMDVVVLVAFCVAAWKLTALFLPFISKLLQAKKKSVLFPSTHVEIVDPTDSSRTDSPQQPKSNRTDPLFIHVFDGIYLALQYTDQAEILAHNMLLGKFTLVNMSSPNEYHCATEDFVPSSLAEIFRFDEMIRATKRHNPSNSIVLCAGITAYVQIKTVFLIGCHLLMAKEFSYEDVASTFAQFDLANIFTTKFSGTPGDGLNVSLCWMALYRAKCIGWVNFDDVFDVGQENSSRIFIEEYIHYASPLNGAVFVVVPGRFILFRAPSDTPKGQLWVDEDGVRRFSAAFYADLLQDLGVKQVLRLAVPTAPRDAAAAAAAAAGAAFRARGIGVEDLCGECGGELSLRALDRFMSLAQGAAAGGGPLAIQCGDGGGDPAAAADLGRAGTLIAAWMLRGGRFGASAEALAWLRIAVPGPAIALEPALLRGGDGAERRGRARSASFQSESGSLLHASRCASLTPDGAPPAAAASAAADIRRRGAGRAAAADPAAIFLRTQSSFAFAPLRGARAVPPSPGRAGPAAQAAALGGSDSGGKRLGSVFLVA